MHTISDARSRVAVRTLSSSLVLAVALGLGACATPRSLSTTAPSAVPTPSATDTVGAPGKDDLVVRDASVELHLESIAIDTNTDGSEIDSQATVDGDELFVFVRQPGWSLQADQYTGDGPYTCASWHATTVVTDLGDGWWSVTPGGEAGSYDVLLQAASGPGLPPGGVVGESSALLTWNTTVSSDEPSPTGEVGFGDSDGPTLNLWYAPTPQNWQAATATVTVTGSAGTPVTFEIPQDRPDCVGRSDVWFDASVTEAELAGIGGEPYTYEVTVTIDDVTHTASATGDDTGSAPLAYSD